MHARDANIVYLTAGAGGMFCGSCLHDNALSAAMKDAGHDVQLVATYTPIRTDGPDVSVDHVLFGGINVYLQQKIPLLRYLPQALDHFLDSPKLIRRMTSGSMNTDAKTLGSLAVSMLKGKTGNQRKEVARMVRWLSLAAPDVLIFSNILIGGSIAEIKRAIGKPVIVTLQGDDVFLDSLLPKYREQSLQLIRQIAQNVDAFVVHSSFYRDHISDYLGIDAAKFHVTPLGLDTHPFEQMLGVHHCDDLSQPRAGEAFTILYLARLAPEKGLHHLVDGFIELRKRPGFENVKLKIAGWQSDQWKDYTDSQWAKLEAASLTGDVENLGSIDASQKYALLQSADLFSVPADFQEPKGLYALEAMAAGVPVLAPASGAFPEMMDATGGGMLTVPGSTSSWADAVEILLTDHARRYQLGQQGQQAVHLDRNAAVMARDMAAVIEKVLSELPK